jgi:acetoin utilization deacetylase AcuC-like enzyme
MMFRAFHVGLILLALNVGKCAAAQNPIRCSIIHSDPDRIVVSWQATPGRSYTLEGRSSLKEPWQSAATCLATTNQSEFKLPIDVRARFFRITESLPTSNLRSDKTPPTGFAYDSSFANYFQNNYEVPERVVSINRRLREQGLLTGLASVVPLAEPRSYIERVHSADHIKAIQAIPLDRDNGATQKIGEIADLAVAYVLGAVRDVCENKIRNAFCNIRPPGHHQINFECSYGFCCYANVVIAARFALEAYPNIIKRVMIIDWDLHHGNGTQFFIQNDPAILFYDTCGGGFYGGGDEKGHGLFTATTGNDGFLREWENEMMPMARAFKPDLILISAGFDSKKYDLMGGLGLTARGYSLLTRKVMDLAEEFSGGRIVSMLEGGYADSGGTSPAMFNGLEQCAENHVRTLMSGELQPETQFYR